MHTPYESTEVTPEPKRPETTWEITEKRQETTARTTTTKRYKEVTTLPPGDTATTVKVLDEEPEVLNSMGTLECEVGVVCRHKVRKDTFRDREEGNTFRLQLSLHLIDEGGPKECFLSKTKRHITCFSLRAGKTQYRLDARDKSLQSASDALVVRMREGLNAEPSHQFDLSLDWSSDGRDHRDFSGNATEIAHFVKRISKFFEDGSDDMIKVSRIESGCDCVGCECPFTEISWSNTSISTEECQEREIRQIEKVLKSDDFAAHMDSIVRVRQVELGMSGVCFTEKAKVPDSGNEEAIAPPPPEKPVEKEEPEVVRKGEEAAAPVSDDNFVVSTIIPVVIIVILLLAAILIACVLWRKNRKRKAAKGEAKNEFVSKGAPVIFPDEVDPLTGKEPSATSPMLVKEERPPLPVAPPAPKKEETPQQQNGRGSRTPVQETHELKERTPLMGSGHTTEHENPLYKPPPPLELGSNTRSPRPNKHSLPHQREPPPYVPP